MGGQGWDHGRARELGGRLDPGIALVLARSPKSIPSRHEMLCSMTGGGLRDRLPARCTWETGRGLVRLFLGHAKLQPRSALSWGPGRDDLTPRGMDDGSLPGPRSSLAKGHKGEHPGEDHPF
jgi:hypothetical protein